MSIFDAQGALPLNLQRTSISGSVLPFDEPLIESVAEDFLAFVLVRSLGLQPGNKDFADALSSLVNYPGLRFKGTDDSLFVFTKDGFSLFDRGTVLKLGVRRLWCFPFSEAFSRDVLSVLPSDVAIVFMGGVVSETFVLDWFRSSLSRQSRFGAFGCLDIAHARTLLRPGEIQRIRRPGAVRKELVSKMKEEASFDGHVVITADSSVGSDIDAFLNAARIQSAYSNSWLTEWTLGSRVWLSEVESPFSKKWMEVLGRAVIPYDEATRKRVFRRAFKRLSNKVKSQQRLFELEQQSKDEK